jgi:cGMP-inhibited 3',5'-cyclic phosphodiesterase A
VLSLLLAAAIHDFDHPGFTNNFLVTTGHQLAILYNDRSVLENHHVASAWKLMISDGKHDFLAGQDDALVNKIRIATIKLVLSTDLAKHTKIIARWRGLFEKGNAFDLKDDNSRLIMMQMIIKCSDIANPAKEYSAHSKWSKLVIEEFYLQGDLER